MYCIERLALPLVLVCLCDVGEMRGAPAGGLLMPLNGAEASQEQQRALPALEAQRSESFWCRIHHSERLENSRVFTDADADLLLEQTDVERLQMQKEFRPFLVEFFYGQVEMKVVFSVAG